MPSISDKNWPLKAQNRKTWKHARQNLSTDANTKGGCIHCDCGEQFESVTQLNRHKKRIHTVLPTTLSKGDFDRQCPNWKRTLKNTAGVKIHLNRHCKGTLDTMTTTLTQEDLDRQYPNCKRVIRNSAGVRIHMSGYCKVSSGAPDITNSNKKATQKTPQEEEKGLIGVTGPKGFQCRICGTPYSTLSGRRRHINAVHGAGNQRWKKRASTNTPHQDADKNQTTSAANRR